MTMNIYITPDNENKLRRYAEDVGSMSGLINRLLAEHFDGPLNTTIKKVYAMTNSEPTNVEIDDTPPEKLKRLATPTTMEEKLGNLQRSNAKYCKNGHAIPNGRDRCMGKGCKYA